MARRGGREHVADLDGAAGDDDAVDEQLGQLTLLGLEGSAAPVEVLALVLEPGRFEHLSQVGPQQGLLLVFQLDRGAAGGCLPDLES